MNIKLNHIVDSDIRVEMDRPELVGTEKQVAWADDIRGAFIRQVEAVVVKAYSQPKQDGSKIEGMDDLYAVMEQVGMIAAIEKVFAKTDAKFWIDNRGASFGQLVQAA